MFLGKAGVMALYAKKYHDRKGKPPHQYLIDHKEKFQKQIDKKNVYSCSQWPKGAWFLGNLFIGCGLTLFYILWNVLDKDNEITLWWRYGIIIGMIMLGILFLITSDRIKIEIHKKYNILYVERVVNLYNIQFNPFLFWKKMVGVKDLDNLEEIKIVKKGHQSYQNTTVYYTLEFKFKEGREDLLEFNELRDVKLKYTEINAFLSKDIDLGQIRINDLSTHYKRKPRSEETENLIK